MDVFKSGVQVVIPLFRLLGRARSQVLPMAFYPPVTSRSPDLG
ncbi:hypothetical protein FRUB_10594 [Fimbriiglobus ruber]|uniref:Uncharacterized protein n=1 Tax=Fimbriiglobus ruber TaxID=1908690 RepID=A0A225D111_9BACT|nr:hypothetical protein FRUB_10594 [Fimbriiglobus ruber]